MTSKAQLKPVTMKRSTKPRLSFCALLLHTQWLQCSRTPVLPLQIKAVDAGSPPKSSTAQLHLESIRQPPPSRLRPLAFQEPFYNFTVMENSSVAAAVGVVSLTQSSARLWLDFTGKMHLESSVSWRDGVVLDTG